MDEPAAKRRILAVLILLTLLTLGLGFLVKDQCNAPTTAPGFSYRSLCTGDISVLYHRRYLDEPTIPYRDYPPANVSAPHDEARGFFEYPPMIAAAAWVAGGLDLATGGTAAGFLYWNAALLALAAVATTWLLFRSGLPPGRVAFFAAGSSLALYAFHNWDLIAVALTMAGFLAYQNRRWGASGILLGLAVATKIYPLVLLPALAIGLSSPGTPLRRRLADARAWRLAAGSVVGFVIPHLIFFAAGGRALLLRAYTFQLGRNPNVETIWNVIWFYGNRAHQSWAANLPSNLAVKVIIAAGFLGVFTFLLVRQWRGRTRTLEAAFGLLLVFLLFNKVFSMQYALWVLPFFALLPAPRWAYAAFAITDAAVYVVLSPFFLNPAGSQVYAEAYAVLATWVILRHGALAARLLWGQRHQMLAPTKRPMP